MLRRDDAAILYHSYSISHLNGSWVINFTGETPTFLIGIPNKHN
jgi:hypothetical protein